MSTMLPLLEPEPVRREDIWAYISPSRLNAWLNCPLKFRLRYIDRIPQPSNPNLFLGKQVHAGLEMHYRHRLTGMTLPADVISEWLLADWDRSVAEERMAFTSVAEEMALRNQAIQLVTAYLQQVPLEEPLPLAVEWRMELPIIDPWTGEDLGIPLLGIVDLVLTGDTGPLVVDFKTSSRSGPPSAITHEIQLSTYAHLFRALSGRNEAGLEIRSLIKTKQPKIEINRYPTRSDQHWRRLFAVIREYLDALDRGRFNYRPSWNCATCQYRDGPCNAWPG